MVLIGTCFRFSIVCLFFVQPFKMSKFAPIQTYGEALRWCVLLPEGLQCVWDITQLVTEAARQAICSIRRRWSIDDIKLTQIAVDEIEEESSLRWEANYQYQSHSRIPFAEFPNRGLAQGMGMFWVWLCVPPHNSSWWGGTHNHTQKHTHTMRRTPFGKFWKRGPTIGLVLVICFSWELSLM